MPYKKLWIAFGLIMFVSFSVLGGVGYKAINNAPPIPSKVITADGRLLFTGETIRDGQNVWQSTGGQEIGTIWGHGVCRSRLERGLSPSPIRHCVESMGETRRILGLSLHAG